MTKTPYELRVDLLKIAQDQLNHRYYNVRENHTRYGEQEATLLEPLPNFPTTEDVIAEAEKLKNFVDSK